MTSNSKNKIFEAAILAEPADAIKLLQRSLGIDDDNVAKLDTPDRREWMRASTGRRLQLLADWLHSAAYLVIDYIDDPKNCSEIVIYGRLD